MKAIPNFPGYFASSSGQIFSNRRGSLKEMKLSVHRDGYFKIMICVEKTKYTRMVHRLVASAWITNSENKREINHKNGDKKDNRVENLEWVTSSENAFHKTSILRKCIGEQTHLSKLTEDQVKEIRSSKEDSLIMSRKFGVHRSLIYLIRQRKIWKHVD